MATKYFLTLAREYISAGEYSAGCFSYIALVVDCLAEITCVLIAIKILLILIWPPKDYGLPFTDWLMEDFSGWTKGIGVILLEIFYLGGFGEMTDTAKAFLTPQVIAFTLWVVELTIANWRKAVEYLARKSGKFEEFDLKAWRIKRLEARLQQASEELERLRGGEKSE